MSQKLNQKMYSKSSRQTKQHIHTCMFCGQSGTELSNNQHATLIEQRERLLLAAKFALSTPGLIRGRDELQRIVDEVLATIERKGEV